MIIKRIIGFVFLAVLIGSFAWKLSDGMRGQAEGGAIIALVLVVILMVLLAVRRVLRA